MLSDQIAAPRPDDARLGTGRLTIRARPVHGCDTNDDTFRPGCHDIIHFMVMVCMALDLYAIGRVPGGRCVIPVCE